MSVRFIVQTEYIILPVIRVDETRRYLIVLYNDKEYPVKQLRFQIGNKDLTKVPCVIVHNSDGTIVVNQDNTALLKERYRVGDIVPFKVKNDFSHNHNGIYELIDAYGFTTYLEKKEQVRLYKNQQVECRILAISKKRPVVELLHVSTGKEGMFSIGAKDVLERMAGCNWNVDGFIRLLFTNEMEETFEAASHKWLVETVKATTDLQTVRKDISALLELSDLLDKCSDDEHQLFQERLSQLIEHIGYYLEAIDLISVNEEEQENRAVHFLNNLMEKLRLSGYVYHPKKNLHIMSSLFLLKPDLMDAKIEELFDVIGCRDLKTWRKEPFRELLIRMLEAYIKEVDSKISLSSTQNRLVNNIIRALAIQLLLAGPDDDALLDMNINRAKLFRYISYLNVPNQEYAIDLAYENLLDLSPQPIAYPLEKTTDVFLLSLILSTPRPSLAGTMDTCLLYAHEHIQLKVRKDSIRFMPSKDIKGCKNVLPAGLLPWRHFEILIPKGMKQAIAENNLTDIYPYQRMWTDIERALLNPPVEKVNKVSKRMMKLVGADVKIRIYRQDDYNPNKFYCRINNVEGKGSIELKPDIVRYSLNTDIRSFYSENGYPLLLEATIQEIDEDGNYMFSMRDKIDEMAKDFSDFADTIVCCIAHYDVRSQKYIGVSKEGFSVSFSHRDGMPQLNKYDVVELDNISFGYSGSLTGTFLQVISGDEPFLTRKAFHQLMLIYANGDEYKGEEEYEEEEETLQSDTIMENTYAAELMMNIDRIASLEPNYIRAYNYLGVAKLLAAILDQEGWVKYYKGRMDLLVMLHDFAVNDELDADRLKDLEAINGEQIKNYTLLYYRFKQLKIVSRLNHPEYNDELWKQKETESNAQLQELALLVLSHNILRVYGLAEQANDVHNKIKNLLQLKVWKSTLKDYGDVEDIQTEFKTSLVYAAGSMKPDLKKQMQLILTVIASMLNTLGGKLFLGVNNEGAGVGLEEDLKYSVFNNDKDKYQLYLRNAILSAFGKVVSAHVRIKFDEENKQKEVCIVEIEPYKEGVLFEDVWYVRQSSRKVVMNQKEFEEYNNHRKGKLADVPTIVIPPDKPLAKEIVEEPKKQAIPQEIKSGKFRYINKDYEYEGNGYICFFENNTYMLSDNPVEEALLCKELLRSDEYLVIVYESGSIAKIPIESLQEKESNQKYNDAPDERIVFVCPAKKVEALLIIFKIRNDTYMRVDYLSHLADGTILDKGKRLTKDDMDEILVCEIMPSGSKDSFRNAKNLTTTGWLLKGKPGEKAMQKLRDLGIVVD